MKFEPTIGLEIHAELKTKTKMFCNSKNDPEEKRPNVNICPVCMGHPGTLPVINKEAVKHVLKMGLAVYGTIADFTEFDRKNYFYPDLPKGYQISQYKYPLVFGGALNGVRLTRIHLEEDTGRSSHDTEDYSLVDFNRSGVPLMELVTEPVVKNAKEAVGFAKELQLLLRYLKASDANMEKGEMRVEVNISLREITENHGIDTEDRGKFGTKVEIKNLNSFKSVEQAIEYEIKRQSEAISRGEKIIQETRGWDEAKGKTFSQRLKEESHDYRYFPDPDLPKLKISEIPEFDSHLLKKEMPELPWERRERYKKEFNDDTIEIFVTNPALGTYLEETLRELKDKKNAKLAANYLRSDVLGLLKGGKEDEELEISTIKMLPNQFAQLIDLVGGGDITSRSAKDVLALMVVEGGDPRTIIKNRGLLQKSDEREIQMIIEKIIAEHANVALDFKSGKEQALQFLIGQGMKATRGSANPKVLEKLFRNMLKM